MARLLDGVMQQLNPDMVRQISRQLGVDEQTAQKGVEMGLPLLMSALARKGASREGAQSLSDELARDREAGLLDTSGDAMRNYQSGSGNALLDQVLGDRRQNVESTLSQSTGMDAGALLQMLAPMVMGALGNTQREQNLDANGLSNTLQRESAEMEQSGSSLMPMITRMLDSNNDGSIVDEVSGMLGNLFNKQR